MKVKIKDDVLRRIENPSENDYQIYFYKSSKHDWIPPRAGYCVGYWIIAKLLKEYDFNEMAKLNEKKVKSLLKKAINQL